MSIRRLSSLFLLFICLNAWGESPLKQIKHVPVKPTSPASGQEMYTAYCAVCHGREGRGNGPAAEALKVRPTDLTILAKRNGNNYPYDRVMSAIEGDIRLPVHGSKEMPAWGGLFWGMSQGHPAEVQQRICNLNKQIESMQRSN